jgi:alpha-1,2-mannosyltransferase
VSLRSSPLVTAALLAAGLLATASAWHDRHPPSSSDFMTMYFSAAQPQEGMYALPPGPPRANLNAPLFQLAMQPLTAFPLPTAAATFRLLNVLSLCGCLAWLACTSRERWGLADFGALLAWAPMASVVTLNQMTWMLWPLLLWAWWCWRQDRWEAGAIGYGVALSLKPFLGVVLLWLIATRRWRAAAVCVATAVAMFAVSLAAYGVDVHRAWLQALAAVTWTNADMNASLEGWLTRTMTPGSAAPLTVAPALVKLLALGGGAIIVVVTVVRTRGWTIERSWLPLLASALLASPLGWLYYIWWMLPGTRPSRLLIETPLLWMPWAVFTMLQPGGWTAATVGSVYFWGLTTIWVKRLWLEEERTERPSLVAEF